MKTLKQKLVDRDKVCGSHVLMNDFISSDIVSSLDYDFIWVDTEHSCIDNAALLNHIAIIKNKGKIHIINTDAFEFLNNNDLNKFDYIFSDIWHNAGDGLPLYLKIKKYETLYPNTKFDYWIETSLLALLRRYVLTVFEEQLDDSTVDDYLNAINENDIIVNKLYFLLIDYEINNEDDLKQLLSDKSLKDIATKLDY